MSTTVEQDEINRFAGESVNWWDKNGVYSSLHKMNPVRLHYIEHAVERHFKRDLDERKALKHLNILDIGCGGGIVCEPLARRGGIVTGLDADGSAIKIAIEHAKKHEFRIDYLHQSAEEHLPDGKGRYDVVLALEILEHISERDLFFKTCHDLCTPGGIMIVSTLNRTAKSYTLGVLMAERVLKWVPPGTHDWQKFVRPSELARAARNSGLKLRDIKGIVYKPVRDGFELSADNTEMNYIAILERPGERALI